MWKRRNRINCLCIDSDHTCETTGSRRLLALGSWMRQVKVERKNVTTCDPRTGDWEKLHQKALNCSWGSALRTLPGVWASEKRGSGEISRLSQQNSGNLLASAWWVCPNHNSRDNRDISYLSLWLNEKQNCPKEGNEKNRVLMVNDREEKDKRPGQEDQRLQVF